MTFYNQAKRSLKGVLLSTVIFASSSYASNSEHEFRKLVSDFVAEYDSLNIPELALGFADNFNRIQDLVGIQRQYSFFRNYKNDLRRIDRSSLGRELGYQYDNLKYEIDLNLERLKLEKSFKNSNAEIPSPDEGIYHMLQGKKWYTYFVKKWTSSNITPEELFAFGKEQVAKVQEEIKAIQKTVGYEGRDAEFYEFLNGADFYITDQTDLLTALNDVQSAVLSNLSASFETINIPLVDIQPIPNPTKDSPPGYYADGVFYYNFYNHSFRKRTLEWLFIHEATPGHHYQSTIAETSNAGFPFSKFFWYPGFSEGWGAYSEDIGSDVGLYRDIFQQLGKWEWDLVRSARVVLDVGLNYKGWTKQQALDYWHQNISNQDDISIREIDRMIRWPAQVHSYKVGEQKFLQLKKLCQDTEKDVFDVRKFHTLVLKRGSLPLEVISQVVKDALDSGKF